MSSRKRLSNTRDWYFKKGDAIWQSFLNALLLKKSQTRISGMNKQILSRYAKEMTAHELAATFFAWQADIRKVIYTTNGIESLNSVSGMLSKSVRCF